MGVFCDLLNMLVENRYYNLARYFHLQLDVGDVIEYIKNNNCNAFLFIEGRELTANPYILQFKQKMRTLYTRFPQTKTFPFLMITCGGEINPRDYIVPHQETISRQWGLAWQMTYESFVSNPKNYGHVNAWSMTHDENITVSCNNKWNASTIGLFIIGKVCGLNRLATIDACMRNEMFTPEKLEWSYYHLPENTMIHKEAEKSFSKFQKHFSFTWDDLGKLERTLSHLENFDLEKYINALGKVMPEHSNLFFNGYPYGIDMYRSTGYTILPETYYDYTCFPQGTATLFSEKYFRAIRNKHPVLLLGGFPGAYDELEKMGLESFRQELNVDVDLLLHLDPNSNKWDQEKFVSTFSDALANLKHSILTKPDVIREKTEHNFNRCNLLFNEMKSKLLLLTGTVYTVYKHNEEIVDIQDYLLQKVMTPHPMSKRIVDFAKISKKKFQ